MNAALFDDAFAAAQKLAAEFRANETHFLSPGYQESEVRKDFVDKLLIALGWDVNHDQQKNPFQQEVKVERGVSTEGSQRRADYAFYIAPNFRKDDVKFFVEAKKPFGDIASAQNCFQTIFYGWNAKTPLAVLTDFEQWVALDCRYKPAIDTAQDRIVCKYRYSDYSDKDKFAEIYYLFSREAVAGGSLEKYAAELPRRRGKGLQRGLLKSERQNVDDSFLFDLDEYRDTLAHAFKNRNPELDGQTLTEITQRVIDRLVFIRFLEDKMILEEPMIKHFGVKGTAWQDFITASRRLDAIYNGIVFKKHAILDTPDVSMDGVFLEICAQLAGADNIYNFDSIPIHILGSIYERFLGKVIVTTDKRARVEDKPEVRKAGGVYYTPEYIVRYIVENTVGKLIEGKSPAQISEMHFADIACGSGSFLLGVYDLLLRYHRDWYNARREKAEKAGCILRSDGAWHLSLSQRREILINNIFGVDIDRQAVEVAQLSLYLKLLEEETTATARAHQLEFHEALLPSLERNITCGNSLIGMDVLEGQLFDPEEERELNPMDFAQRFPEVTQRGGFDAIVGNPPWGYSFTGPARHYLVQKHPRIPSKTKDSYFYFIFQAIEKMREGGWMGLIVPNTWLLINAAKPVRDELLSLEINEIRDYGDGVFKEATVESSTLILRKSRDTNGKCHAVRLRKGTVVVEQDIPKRLWLDDECSRIILDINPASDFLLRKLRNQSEVFENHCAIIWGIKPYQVGHGDPPQTREMVDQRIYHSQTKRGAIWKPLLVGADIDRYHIHFPSNQFIKYGKWLMYPSNASLMTGPKILMRQTSDQLRCCYDDTGLYCQNSVFIIHSQTVPLKLLLGILNSRLLNFVYQLKNPQKGKVFAEIKPSVVKELPIHTAAHSANISGTVCNRMVAQVDQMLAAKKRLAEAKSEGDRSYYAHKCSALDRQIDALVYELYGLTEEEIRMVEAAAR